MTVAADTNEKPTAERILDIAERLVQTRGVANFSSAGLAAELGLARAGLHFHCPGAAGPRHQSPLRVASK